MAQPQTNVALNKPVFVSSLGGDISHLSPHHATDGDHETTVYTERSSPWSFVAVDLEDTYEISSITFITDRTMRKFLYTTSFVRLFMQG